MPWRVGTKVPINVYENDIPVCQCQTADQARRIVKAMNSVEQPGEIVLRHGDSYTFEIDSKWTIRIDFNPKTTK